MHILLSKCTFVKQIFHLEDLFTEIFFWNNDF